MTVPQIPPLLQLRVRQVPNATASLLRALEPVRRPPSLHYPALHSLLDSATRSFLLTPLPGLQTDDGKAVVEELVSAFATAVVVLCLRFCSIANGETLDEGDGVLGVE